MITVPHAEVLAKELTGEGQEVKKTIFEGRGHVLFWEEREDFRKLIIALIDQTTSTQ